MITIVDHNHEGEIHSATLFPNNKVGLEAANAFAKKLIEEYYNTEREDEPSQELEDALESFVETGEWKDFSSAVTREVATLGEIPGSAVASVQHERDDLPTYITLDNSGEGAGSERFVGKEDIILGEGIPTEDRLALAEIGRLFLNSKKKA